MTAPPELLYHCDTAALGDAAPLFAPLAPDAELEQWLGTWRGRPHGRLLSALNDVLSGYASSYDVHGWLGAYQMHLLSAEAWGQLLQGGRFDGLLDVGAGAGYVTEGARGYFRHITCTETASALRRRLTQRGFEVLADDLSERTLERQFDVVSCFNVLDRTARPLTLLRALREHVKPGGLLLVSMPLPLRPHVHVKGGTVSARERLPSSSERWEDAARDLTARLFQGLTVERLVRLPYLSRGDHQQPLYVLDAALWVCRR